MKISTPLAIFGCFLFIHAFAQEHDHDHQPGEKSGTEKVKQDKKESDHKAHEEGENKEEGHHAEEIQISSEAMLRMKIETQELKGKSPWKISQEAVLISARESAVYRFRDGKFSRVDFKTVRTEGDWIWITSDDLKMGDQLVIAGVRFVRLAELDALAGEEGGHAH